MNQKDYKKIAGIINANRIQMEDNSNYVINQDFVSDLAAYFEKEDYDNNTIATRCFNRQQFLKDCGVEK